MGSGSSAAPFKLHRSLVTNDDLKYRGRERVEVHPVWSITLSRSGQRLASATGDNLIHLWCFMTWEILVSLRGHTDTIWFLEYAPNDRVLASASSDNTIRLWEPEAGVPISILRGHTHWVLSLAFSSDSSRLISAGADSKLLLWDVWNTAPIATWQAHEKSIHSVVFYPGDSERVVSCSADGTVAFWWSQTGELRGRAQGHEGSVLCAAVCPINEDLVATGGEDCSVRLWSMETIPATEEGGPTMMCTHQNTIKAHSKSVWTLKFTQDGLLLASGSSDCSVRLWAIESSKRTTLAAHFLAHDSWIRSLCWSSGSEMLITGSTDGVISLWNTPKRFHASSLRSKAMLREERSTSKSTAITPYKTSEIQ